MKSSAYRQIIFPANSAENGSKPTTAKHLSHMVVSCDVLAWVFICNKTIKEF